MSAATYVNSSGEVAIAFRGTDDPIGLFQTDWQQGNIPGALGWYAPQVAAAMRLLADVVAEYPTAPITLTGHSLGGGLASLLATYFDLPAVVFDPAPFGAAAAGLFYNLPTGWMPSSAVSQQYYDEFQQYLGSAYPVGGTSSATAVALSNLRRSFFDLNDGVESYEQRRVNTSGFFLRGEGLEPYRNIFPMASLALTPVETGATQLTDSVALHSMPLLLAMMSSPALRIASARLPTLLPQIMDEGLYAFDDHSQQANFLNRLLAQQLDPASSSATSALDRFAQDLLELGASGSARLPEVDRALIATAMEYYYFSDLADPTPFISEVPGGISFDVRRIPPSSDQQGQTLLLDRVRDLVTAGTGELARFRADSAAIWTIQSGSAGLATDGHAEGEVQIGAVAQPNVLHGADGDDLLISGSADDALYGGAGADVLLGGAGGDLLVGDGGNDQLAGGAGFDLYSFGRGDGFDSIVGDDDDGRILIDGALAAGGDGAQRLRWIVNPSWHWSSGGVSLDAILVGGSSTTSGGSISYSNGTLLLRRSGSDDWVSIQDFATADLGLNLRGGPGSQSAPALPDPTTMATAIRQQLSAAKQTVSPLILDLDGDGVETTHISAGTHFDHDANGFAEATGWVGADDGLLVMDRNGNGVIDNGHELFGNNTLLPNGSYAGNGFAALAALDSSGDGRLSAADPAWSQLRVWKDANGNAVVEAGELLTLAAAGVSGIATAYAPLHAIETNGNAHLQAGTYTTSAGLTRSVEDVWFAANTTQALAPAPVPVSAQIEALPDVAGFGNVASLHQAMQLDASGHLRDLVGRYSSEADPAVRAALLQSILFAWTGVESVDPASRGGYIDARALGVLEAFAGEGFVQGYGTNAGTPNPAANAAGPLDAAYARLAAYVDAQLMAQTHLRALYESVAVGLAADGESISWDISATLRQLQAAYDADPRAGTALLKSFAASLRYDAEIGAPVIAALRSAGGADATGFARALFVAAADDIVEGTDGADVASGGAGDDLVLGRGGNDSLGGGAGDDVIDGGSGDDLLYGHAGSDTYLFGRGSGQDTIDNFDLDPARCDVVELRPDVREQDVTLTRLGDDLVIGIAGLADRASVRNYFRSGTASGSAIDGIRFASGTFWDRAEINEQLLQALAGEGADTLRAFATEVRLHGLGGNDGIIGSAGNDELYGDAGDDTLAAGSGDDRLAGGPGVDWLAGEAGNNVYRFDRGDGQDTISAFYDTTAGRLNTLEFGAGISPGELILRRDNYYDLVIGIAGTTDSVTIRDAHYAALAPVQQLRFADGTTLALTRVMAAGDSSLSLDAAGALIALGNDAANTISGSALSNVIDGGAGADALAGGTGDDTYIVDTARSHYFWEDSSELWNFLDSVAEQGGEGYDTIIARDVYSAALPANVERLIVQGRLAFTTSFNLAQDVRRRFTGNALDNVIDASAATGGSVGQGNTSGTGIDLGETVIDGGAGADLMIGPTTKTRFVIDNPGDVVISHSAITRVDAAISYTLAAGFADLTLIGSAAISGTGNALGNVLDGSANAAANLLAGGAGNDTYVVGAGDLVQEATGEGVDTVRSGVSYTLPDNVENLTLGGNGSTTGRGNALDNVIVGTDSSLAGFNGQNYLVGGGGNDQLAGGSGDDTYADFDVATGLDTLYDSSGGADRMQSVLNSAYVIEQLQFSRSGNDLLIGVDAADGIRVQSWYASPSNVIETLAINNDGLWYPYSSAQVQGRADGVNTAPAVYAPLASQSATTGQPFACQFDGNAFLDIESQHSLLYTATLTDGSALPPWLRIDSATRTLSGTPPSGSAGTLGIKVTATDAGGLAASNTFSLTIAAGASSSVGTEGNDSLVGDAADNVMQGLGGDDTLDGRGGNDRLYGGLGNDTLDGGTGADQMYGGVGDDVYVVDDAADFASEDQGGGVDEVRASISFTLGADLDNLTLTGTSAINGTGNALANVIRGNAAANRLSGDAGNDTLDGGAGGDTMAGGSGDDVYYVDASTDVTSETAAAGLDSVFSGVTRTLSANIELLFLSGANAINGTGNTLANLLRGNGANNVLAGGGGTDILEGGAGNDTLSNTGNNSLLAGGAGTDRLSGAGGNDLLIGGLGNDALTTGSGADVIVFNKGDGADTVAASTTRDNTVSLGGGARYADLLFQKSGNDLILKIGAADQITFTGYYASASNHSVKTLQMVIEGTADYSPASSSALNNRKIESFSFDGLVAAFDAARAANPKLTSWALTSALAAQYLAGSDTAAIGGDLAYLYARSGNLAGVSFLPAASLLGAAGFGSSAQALQTATRLQDVSARLS